MPSPRVRSITLGVLEAADAATLPDFAPLQRYLNPAWMESLEEERVLEAMKLVEGVLREAGKGYVLLETKD